MVSASDSAPGNGLTQEKRELLERIAIRLLVLAARCADATIQQELMELADQLARVLEA